MSFSSILTNGKGILNTTLAAGHALILIVAIISKDPIPVQWWLIGGYIKSKLNPRPANKPPEPTAERARRLSGKLLRRTAKKVGRNMKGFGSDNPREMPAHFFYRALKVRYETAVHSDPEKQNCSVCPRYWYIDAIFPCDRCGDEFTFSAAEQRVWYEDYGFWVDSVPRHCLACRQDLRNLKAVRQEYDQNVTRVLADGDLESKKQLARVIDQLYEFGGELPPQINENRRRLANQIARANS